MPTIAAYRCTLSATFILRAAYSLRSPAAKSAKALGEDGNSSSHAGEMYDANEMHTHALARLHGVDLLRALMMLLGIVLHVALSFIEGPATGEWLYRDPQRSPAAGLIFLAIHVFRMPVFFVMAGIFAALIWQRQGVWGFIRHRIYRLLVPLLAGWIVLFPVVKWVIVWGLAAQTPEKELPAVAGLALLVAMKPWSDPNLIHLWFLYQLLVLCAAAMLLCCAWRLVPVRPRDWGRRFQGILVVGRLRWLRVPILVIATALCLTQSAEPILETSAALLPPLHVLGGYAVCFFGGWVFMLTPGALQGLQRLAWLKLAMGVLAVVVAVLASIAWFGIKLGDPTATAQISPVVALRTAQWSNAIAIWLIALGGIGALERILTRPIGWVRSLCEASFWIYLVHLPICLASVIMLRAWDASALMKMLVAIAITLLVSLLTFWAACAVVGVRVRRPHAATAPAPRPPQTDHAPRIVRTPPIL